MEKSKASTNLEWCELVLKNELCGEIKIDQIEQVRDTLPRITTKVKELEEELEISISLINLIQQEFPDVRVIIEGARKLLDK